MHQEFARVDVNQSAMQDERDNIRDDELNEEQSDDTELIDELFEQAANRDRSGVG